MELKFETLIFRKSGCSVPPHQTQRYRSSATPGAEPS
jgi:hypothetical protein